MESGRSLKRLFKTAGLIKRNQLNKSKPTKNEAFQAIQNKLLAMNEYKECGHNYPKRMDCNCTQCLTRRFARYNGVS
jgi:hypothetical protein